jgi:hypothetical protein
MRGCMFIWWWKGFAGVMGVCGGLRKGDLGKPDWGICIITSIT